MKTNIPPLDYKKLIQGRYEDERFSLNSSSEQSVPDFSFNVLNPLGLLYRPVGDELYLENGGKKPVWPQNRPFAVCLTHDVDAVSLYAFRQSSRKRSLQFRLNKKIWSIFGFGYDLIQIGEHFAKPDPLHCFEHWIEEERRFGAHSTFFFWPGFKAIRKTHYTDCMFELSDPIVFDGHKQSVAEMIQKIEQFGWEIGLHPSWYSFNDLNELLRQKESIERVLGHNVLSVRQHCLHYDIRITPRIHERAGFKYDSSLGFNDNIGFRFGTCFPWNIHDIDSNSTLSITEIPLIIQDNALLNPKRGLRLDEKTAFEYILQLTQEVEKVGGVLTLLWHTNTFINHNYWALYRKTLKYLHEKNAWLASVKEIGEWWKTQREKTANNQ